MHEVSLKPVPDAFVGVWRCVSFAVGNDPPSQYSRVVWMQARSRFADIRTPAEGAPAGVEPKSFSGYASWDAPRLTWNREIDLGEPRDDIGTMSWRGEDLIESGELQREGQTLAFEEVWRRTPLDGDALLALEAKSEQPSSGRSRPSFLRARVTRAVIRAAGTRRGR